MSNTQAARTNIIAGCLLIEVHDRLSTGRFEIGSFPYSPRREHMYLQLLFVFTFTMVQMHCIEHKCCKHEFFFC